MTDYTKPFYPNLDDYTNDFWNNNYKITVSAQGIEFFVNADCSQDAIDIVIDDCEKNHPGLIMSIEDEENEQCQYLDDYICGGNHNRYFSTYNVQIEKL